MTEYGNRARAAAGIAHNRTCINDAGSPMAVAFTNCAGALDASGTPAVTAVPGLIYNRRYGLVSFASRK